jgi:hypothetical protein
VKFLSTDFNHKKSGRKLAQKLNSTLEALHEKTFDFLPTKYPTKFFEPKRKRLFFELSFYKDAPLYQ